MRAVLASAAALLAAAAPAPDPRIGELRRLTDNLGRAWETGDRARADAIYAEDFVDVAMDGVRRGKAEVVAFIRPAATAAAQIAFAPSDHRYVFHGPDVGVVTYRNRDCRDRPEGRRCFDFTASEVFTRRDGRWQLVLGQQSAIPDDATDPDTAAGAARDAVLMVEAAMRDAQLRNDVARVGTLLATDWRMTLGDGRVVDRAKFLDDVRSFWKPTALAHGEQQVRVFGDAATVTGVARSDWTGRDGQPKFARERYSDVYARSYGAWRKVATHLSCLEGSC